MEKNNNFITKYSDVSLGNAPKWRERKRERERERERGGGETTNKTKQSNEANMLQKVNRFVE